MQAIHSVEWPEGSGTFVLHDDTGRGRGQGNGVKPTKDACMALLAELGWDMETPLKVAALGRPGPVDASCRLD